LETFANQVFNKLSGLSNTVAGKMAQNETKEFKTPNAHLVISKTNSSELSGNSTKIKISTGGSIDIPNFCELSNMSNCSNAAITQQVIFLF
jgi:hypothetical protein